MSRQASRRLSFDLDGTLVTNAFTSHVMPDIAARLGMADRPDEVRSALMARHERMLADGRTVAAYDWQTHVDDLAEEVGGRPGTVDVAELAARHNTADRVTVIHPGTGEILTALRADGWRIAVITNGFRVFQEPVLAVSGLREVVDEVVTTDDVGHAKPHRAIFGAVFAGAGPDVHVGDRIEHDVMGACDAGARSVLLRGDAPVEGRTADLDAEQRTALVRFCAERLRAERSTAADQDDPPLPDITVHRIRDLPAALERLG